ncbi:MAG: vanadium-dependent haloperoxidase [Flavobacteriales bacterium]|nr:vanadium-dependent haloperoxidase [Flavobacteriales bacterium]
MNKLQSKVFISVLLIPVTVFVVALFLVQCGGNESGKEIKIKNEEAGLVYVEQWMKLTREYITSEFISPPEASRIFAYTGLAIYESIIPAYDQNQSYASILNGQLSLPSSSDALGYDFITVMSECVYLVTEEALKRHVSTYDVSIKELRDQQIAQRRLLFEKVIIEKSIEHGQAMGNAFVKWMRTDGYDTTRANVLYQPPSRINNPAGWEPTDFGQVPMEPFWKELRPFVIEDKELCNSGKPIEFSTDSSSAFYKAAYELVEYDKNITSEQMEIILFWADCPGDTPTPAGHWNAIMGQLVSQKNLSLIITARIYAVVGMGISDAFILCWKKKYEINLVRPKTYIQDFIGPDDWEPFVETPPFPEFTAGHAVISGTAAGLLTTLIGDSVGFTDGFHNSIGLMSREFDSFYEAASEAGMSRVYGGIHYRFTIEKSKSQAKCIVEQVVKKLEL